MGWAGGGKRVIDMRAFIENELAKWELGALVAVVGPEKTTDDWFKLTIKYRPPGNEHRKDIQFYDKNIVVNIGYSRKAGYWNRTFIRKAIRNAGQEFQEEKVAAVVWSSMPRELTTGRDEDGRFAL
jgi:hypothetical protein